MQSELGAQLEALCRSAQQEVVLVAPFVKAYVLKRLLICIEKGVHVRCVTRWRLEEIAAGVSDLEAWSIINEHSGASLWLRTDLHAKYYRADDHCLVGSANLTGAALGWSSSINFELLTPLSRVSSSLAEFESTLFGGCIEADSDIYNGLKEMVAGLQHETVRYSFESVERDIHSEDIIENEPPQKWLPKLRDPESLYWAYSERWEELSTASRTAARSDLMHLPVQSGLSRESFERCVGSLLLQKPIIKQIDSFVVVPQRFGAVRDLLEALTAQSNLEFSASYAWQTLMRWLLYFLPNRYRHDVPRHSEIFQRV